MVSWVIVKFPHKTSPKGKHILMSKSITQDMACRQSLKKHTEKYGVSRAAAAMSPTAFTVQYL